MERTPQQIIGIALKDRDPADIRRALTAAGVEEEHADWFLKLHAYACAQHPPLGLSALANRSRIGSSILSQCFSGSYPGDYAAIAERVKGFFWRLEQAALYGGLRQFCETSLAQAIWTLCDKTRVTRRIQWVRSPEQVGKTRSVVEYAARNNTGRTVYVKLGGGNQAGCNQFIWDLAEALEIPYSIKLAEKRVRIKHALASCDLLILDEVHLCWGWTDASLRMFFDYLRTDLHADGARGIVLVATNDDPMGSLQNFRRRARYNVGQLLGRMRNQICVIDPAEDITEEDVRLLVTRYYRPGAVAIRKLHDYACRPGLGHFGLIEDLMNEAWTLAKARKRALDDAAVLTVAEEVLGELKERKPLYE